MLDDLGYANQFHLHLRPRTIALCNDYLLVTSSTCARNFGCVSDHSVHVRNMHLQQNVYVHPIIMIPTDATVMRDTKMYLPVRVPAANPLMFETKLCVYHVR